MNESAAKSLKGAQSEPFDIEQFEQRLRGTQPRPPGHDPLVELAQLVNSAEDPFRDLFADPAVAQALSQGAAQAPVQQAAAPVPPPAPAEPVADYPDFATEMLRSVADQMRSPPSATQNIASQPKAPAFAPPQPVYPAGGNLADQHFQHPSAAGHQPQPVRPVAPPPVAAGDADEFAGALGLPREPSYAAPALRGSIAPEVADPVDEFEQSIVQLVAARTANPAVAGQVPPPSPYPPQPPQAAPLPPVAAPDASALVQDWQQNAHPEAAYDHQPPYDPALAYSDAPNVGVRPATPPDWLNDAHTPHPAAYGDHAAGNGRSRKPMYYMGGAIAVMVLGIGATLAMRSSGPAAGDIPTITAATKDIKVKADQSASKPVRTVSVLNAGEARMQAAKVVSSAEQPIDLAQVPDEPKRARRIREEELSKKLNLADRNLTRPIASAAPKIDGKGRASGYFPEPRKVRTVMVRPDGSLIDPTASISASKAAGAAPAKRVARIVTPTPEAGERAVPRRAAPAAQPARAKATPRVRAVSRAQPDRATRTAAIDLTPKRVRSQAPASRGGFAVQLAAPASEGAARSVANKARARFGSIFGGRTPGVHRAVVKSRTVYRVRVTGLDRGSASRMCSQVKAKGGSCYVARN
ncbi:MAG: SPOR domain-containing protein [Hyphomicrobiales bacterium]|nr:SPOR domain-containing protein [Hyphomicrobiales bacterium]